MEDRQSAPAAGEPAEGTSSLRLTALEPPRRATFLGMLGEAGIDHEVVGDEVRFDASARAAAQRLLLAASSDRPVTSLPPEVLAHLPGAADGGGGLRPASTARRVAGALGNAAAYLLLLVGVMGALVVADALGGSSPAGTSSAGDPSGGPVLAFATNALPAVLAVLFTGLAGGTPGVLLFGMRVVRPDGRRAGFARSAARAAVTWGPWVVLCYVATGGVGGGVAAALGLLLVVWALLLTWSVQRRADRRGWQDLAGGVQVVDVGPVRLRVRAGSGLAR